MPLRLTVDARLERIALRQALATGLDDYFRPGEDSGLVRVSGHNDPRPTDADDVVPTLQPLPESIRWTHGYDAELFRVPNYAILPYLSNPVESRPGDRPLY